MSQKTALQLREGDVYRFRYSDAAIKQFNGRDPYWCFDGQLVMCQGRLCDTYWGFGQGSETRIVTPIEGDLTFVCNLNDIREIKEYETRHYAESDTFDLSYQRRCYKRFVVKKDAQPNQARIIEEIRLKENDVRAAMERAVRFGAGDLVQLGELREAVKRGDLTKKPWW